MASPEGTQADVKPEKVTIEVVFERQSTKFMIKKSMNLKKVLDKFEQGVLRMEPNTLRFTYNGEAVRREHDVTPMDLDMEDGDHIDAHLGQVGGRF